jgi:DNA-binding NtrC family response regulator
MSIHILTTDEAMQEQLTQLLAGGQETFSFYTDLEELIAILPKLKKVDTVFYDLQLEDTLWAFDAIHYGAKKTNLVAFEPVIEGSSEGAHRCPANAKHYLVLSSDMRRSKVRLQKVTNEINQLSVKKKAAKRKRERKRAAESATVARVSASQDLGAVIAPVTVARHLTTRSPAMQEFAVQISEVAERGSLILIESEDGAEFELAARELNFRANGDAFPLMVLDPMDLCAAQLRILSKGKNIPCYCYIGLSYELTSHSVGQLADTLKSVFKKRGDSPIRLILGHVIDSEDYVSATAMDLVKMFRKDGSLLQLPGMCDRKEDVSVIAQSVFTMLRVAHPFLCTRTFTSKAVQFLEDGHESLDYSRLVRVIRNSMALTQRDTLTEVELKNFSDDSPTSQHLIESLADETYFADQSGVVNE